MISYDYALEYLINLVRNSIDTNKYNGIPSNKEKLSYLRALAIGTLVNEAATVFLKNEEAILKGEFENSLLDISQFEAQTSDIIKLCVEKVYQSDEVVEKEIAGYQILSNLMNAISTSLMNQKQGNPSNFDTLLLKKLGISEPIEELTTYELLLKASSLVAGLSDGAAVYLNRLVTGNHL